jgi:hypothetical protein
MEHDVKSKKTSSQKLYYIKKIETDDEFHQSELKRWKEYNKNRYQNDVDDFRQKTLQKLKDKYYNDEEFRTKKLAYNREYAKRKKAERDEARNKKE